MVIRFVIAGLALLAVALATGLGIVLLGSGDLGPGTMEARALEVEIREGKIIQGDLEARNGEIVTLRVTSDEPWLFEIHGMDVEGGVTPGKVLLLPFEAVLEGRFEIGLHPAHEGEEIGNHEHDQGVGDCKAEAPAGAPAPQVHVVAAHGEEPGEIVVAVDLENFVLGMASAGTGLATGHWHLNLNGELKGMYGVSEASVFVAGPGEYKVMATLSDTEHCGYGVSAMTTIVVEKGGREHKTDKDEELEEGEVIAGFIDLLPN